MGVIEVKTSIFKYQVIIYPSRKKTALLKCSHVFKSLAYPLMVLYIEARSSQLLSCVRFDTSIAKHTNRSKVKSALTSASPVYNCPSEFKEEIITVVTSLIKLVLSCPMWYINCLK